MFNPWIISVFSLYFIAIIGIALHKARQMRNMSDYVLGGRRVSSITTGLSAGSSLTSAWTLLVLPAMAFQYGIATVWIVVGIVAQVWVAWVILAKRLRRMTIAADDALTPSQFLEKRFADKSGTLRTLAALVLIFFIIIYVSSALVAGSKLLTMTFGLRYELGVVVTLIAIASYTFIGGFLAVSRTDVFQAIFMFTGLAVLTATLMFHAEVGFTQNGIDLGDLSKSLATDDSQPSLPMFSMAILGWGIGIFGSQRVIQRFIAIKNENAINTSRNIAVTWVTAVYFLCLAVGLLALPVLVDTGTLSQVLEDPERIFMVLTNTLFHPVVVGVLLVAVVAAIMSTADSQLLLASAVVTDDLPVIRDFTRTLGTSGSLWAGRLMLLIVGACAAIIAVIQPESILDLVALAWGGMGAAFGPVTILALYWRRFNYWGAFASIVAGTVIASIWGMMTGGPFEIWDIHLATTGFILTFPIAIGVTLLTSKPPPEVTKLFDEIDPEPEVVEFQPAIGATSASLQSDRTT